MDEKIKAGLQELANSNDQILLKKIGITKTIATTLEKLGFIKLSVLQSGNKPVKTPNAAVITDLGRSFIFLTENPDFTKEIKLQRSFNEFFQTVENTYNDLKDLTVAKPRNGRKSNFFLTENLVLREIESFKSSVKATAEIPSLVTSLMEKTKLPKNTIHNYLNQMALNNKIFFQSGESDGDPLIALDGSKYYYIK